MLLHTEFLVTATAVVIALFSRVADANKGVRKVHFNYPTELLPPITGSIFSGNVTRDKLTCFGNRDYPAPTYHETFFCMLPYLYFPNTLNCHSVWGSRSVVVEVIGSVEFLKVMKLPQEVSSRPNSGNFDDIGDSQDNSLGKGDYFAYPEESSAGATSTSSISTPSPGGVMAGQRHMVDAYYYYELNATRWLELTSDPYTVTGVETGTVLESSSSSFLSSSFFLSSFTSSAAAKSAASSSSSSSSRGSSSRSSADSSTHPMHYSHDQVSVLQRRSVSTAGTAASHTNNNAAAGFDGGGGDDDGRYHRGVVREVLQIPAEPIYLCARSNDWHYGTDDDEEEDGEVEEENSELGELEEEEEEEEVGARGGARARGGGGGHHLSSNSKRKAKRRHARTSSQFYIHFRDAYLREKDKRLCNDQMLVHILLIVAVSSVWFVPYLAALVAATLSYIHGIKVMLSLLVLSCCVVCCTPLMLTRNNRHTARLLFNYFFTRVQAEETRHVMKRKLPLFQALFFSSALICVGFATTYVIYHYVGVDRETRNSMFKLTISVAVSWFVFVLCRSFERFIRDWIWVVMSISLAHILENHLNPQCRDKVIVSAMVISQIVKLLLPRFFRIKLVGAVIRLALPGLQHAATILKIPLPEFPQLEDDGHINTSATPTTSSDSSNIRPAPTSSVLTHASSTAAQVKASAHAATSSSTPVELQVRQADLRGTTENKNKTWKKKKNDDSESMEHASHRRRRHHNRQQRNEEDEEEDGDDDDDDDDAGENKEEDSDSENDLVARSQPLMDYIEEVMEGSICSDPHAEKKTFSASTPQQMDKKRRVTKSKEKLSRKRQESKRPAGDSDIDYSSSDITFEGEDGDDEKQQRQEDNDDDDDNGDDEEEEEEEEEDSYEIYSTDYLPVEDDERFVRLDEFAVVTAPDGSKEIQYYYEHDAPVRKRQERKKIQSPPPPLSTIHRATLPPPLPSPVSTDRATTTERPSSPPPPPPPPPASPITYSPDPESDYALPVLAPPVLMPSPKVITIGPISTTAIPLTATHAQAGASTVVYQSSFPILTTKASFGSGSGSGSGGGVGGCRPSLARALQRVTQGVVGSLNVVLHVPAQDTLIISAPMVFPSSTGLRKLLQWYHFSPRAMDTLRHAVLHPPSRQRHDAFSSSSSSSSSNADRDDCSLPPAATAAAAAGASAYSDRSKMGFAIKIQETSTLTAELRLSIPISKLCSVLTLFDMGKVGVQRMLIAIKYRFRDMQCHFGDISVNGVDSAHYTAQQAHYGMHGMNGNVMGAHQVPSSSFSSLPASCSSSSSSSPFFSSSYSPSTSFSPLPVPPSSSGLALDMGLLRSSFTTTTEFTFRVPNHCAHEVQFAQQCCLDMTMPTSSSHVGRDSFRHDVVAALAAVLAAMGLDTQYANWVGRHSQLLLHAESSEVLHITVTAPVLVTQYECFPASEDDDDDDGEEEEEEEVLDELRQGGGTAITSAASIALPTDRTSVNERQSGKDSSTNISKHLLQAALRILVGEQIVSHSRVGVHAKSLATSIPKIRKFAPNVHPGATASAAAAAAAEADIGTPPPLSSPLPQQNSVEARLLQIDPVALNISAAVALVNLTCLLKLCGYGNLSPGSATDTGTGTDKKNKSGKTGGGRGASTNPSTSNRTSTSGSSKRSRNPRHELLRCMYDSVAVARAGDVKLPLGCTGTFTGRSYNPMTGPVLGKKPRSPGEDSSTIDDQHRHHQRHYHLRHRHHFRQGSNRDSDRGSGSSRDGSSSDRRINSSRSPRNHTRPDEQSTPPPPPLPPPLPLPPQQQQQQQQQRQSEYPGSTAHAHTGSSGGDGGASVEASVPLLSNDDNNAVKEDGGGDGDSDNNNSIVGPGTDNDNDKGSNSINGVDLQNGTRTSAAALTGATASTGGAGKVEGLTVDVNAEALSDGGMEVNHGGMNAVGNGEKHYRHHHSHHRPHYSPHNESHSENHHKHHHSHHRHHHSPHHESHSENHHKHHHSHHRHHHSPHHESHSENHHKHHHSHHRHHHSPHHESHSENHHKHHHSHHRHHHSPRRYVSPMHSPFLSDGYERRMSYDSHSTSTSEFSSDSDSSSSSSASYSSTSIAH